jgi:uncharacterized protein
MLSDSPSIKQFIDEPVNRPYRYTLCITMNCNLACEYCYVTKNHSVMSISTAKKAVDFLFQHAPPPGNIEFGFFGGESFLEFPLLQEITEMIENHPSFDPERVFFQVTTNGTIFSESIARFLKEHSFAFCISCDGPPNIQNLSRRTITGGNSSHLVEKTLIHALKTLPVVQVNSVYNPQTFRYLPDTLDYLSDLGIRRIFLNPDFSSNWSINDIDDLNRIYNEIGNKYIKWYLNNTPHFISLIDTKITTLIRGGYHPSERCHMGTHELSITPDGGLYPCERLIGSGLGDKHCIGSIDKGLDFSKLLDHCSKGKEFNPECEECSLKDCCMNWCGCSNSLMTGYYNRVGPILCASERASIQTAFEVYVTLEKELGPIFLHHLSGLPQLNVIMEPK